MDKTVKIYTSEGGHSAKTWGRIITNRIIDTAADASPELQQKYQNEKHRIEALIASYIPTIRSEALKNGN